MSDDGKIWVTITAAEKRDMTEDQVSHAIIERGIQYDPRRPISYFLVVSTGDTLVSQQKESTMSDTPTSPRTVADVSLNDMIRSVGRELGKRRGAYPKFVAAGTLSQAEADEEILRMSALYGRLKTEEQVATGIRIVCNEVPGKLGVTFVGVESFAGKGIDPGPWHNRDDGNVEVRIPGVVPA